MLALLAAVATLGHSVQGRPIRVVPPRQPGMDESVTRGHGPAIPDIGWLTPEGEEMTDEHWDSSMSRSQSDRTGWT